MNAPRRTPGLLPAIVALLLIGMPTIHALIERAL